MSNPFTASTLLDRMDAQRLPGVPGQATVANYAASRKEPDDPLRIEARRRVLAYVMEGNDVPDAEALEDEIFQQLVEERDRPPPPPPEPEPPKPISRNDVRQLLAKLPVKTEPIAPITTLVTEPPKTRRALILPKDKEA